jgi:hypothetical protein
MSLPCPFVWPTTTTFLAEDLIFGEPRIRTGVGYDGQGNAITSTYNDWKPMDWPPARGDVICWAADRCPPWGIFVVLGVHENKIKAICPRIHLTGDVVELGVDRTPGPPYPPVPCTCIHIGGDGCGCGAFAAIRAAYAATFVAMTNVEYRVIDVERASGHMYLEHVQRDQVNDCDVPDM